MNRIVSLLLIIAVSLVSACKKTPSNSTGSNSIVYESQSNINLMSDYSEFVNKANLYVENATPYEQMMGSVMASASENLIDNNGTQISNIQFSNVRISDIHVTCKQNLNDLNTMLQSCDMIMQYFDYDAGNYVDVELATFYDVNMQSAEIDFNLAAIDLLPILEKRPDRLVFKFQFSDRPSQDIEFSYRIVFDYNYSYDENELKN